MIVTYKEISNTDYDSLRTPVLFEDKKADRLFGTITNGKQEFRFGWRSNLIKPEIKEIKENIYSIGIDENFVIVDFSANNVILNLKLLYPYYTTEIFNNIIFIATELEIIKIDKSKFKVMSEYTLPEFYEYMIPVEDGFDVHCANNITIYIK